MTTCSERVARGWAAALVLAGLGLLMASSASAQMREWTGNGFISVNGGYQTGDRTLSQSLSSPLYDEVADYAIRHASGSGGVFDASGGVRVWRSLAAGFGVTAFNNNSTLDVTGTVPHPLFFDSPRNAALTRTDLNHRQLAFHFQAVYVISITDDIDVSVFGGPSVLRVEQDIVTAVSATEVGEPFDMVNVGVTTSTASERGAGVNVGADVTYMFTEQLGAGGFFRFAGGSLDLPVGNTTVEVDVGGAQVGGGLRLRF